MNKSGSVLILSPWLSQSISCAKLLKKHKINLKIMGGILSGEKQLPFRGAYDGFIKVTEDNFEKLCNEYDLVLPTGIKGTQLFFKIYSCLKIGSIAMEHSVLKCCDKKYVLDIADKIGIKVPGEFRYDELNNPDFNRPFFFKPRNEGFNGPRSWVKDFKSLPEEVKRDNKEYLFQEKVDSPGVYGVGFTAENGSILFSTSHYEVLSYPKDGGSAAIIESFYDQRLLDLTEKLIKNIGYSGWGLVEFKWCPIRNDYVLMEINTKLWASFEFALRADPLWKKSLFSIDTTEKGVKGLIWPVRLIGGGLPPSLSSLKSFFIYDKIYESGESLSIISSLLPDFIKKLLKFLLRLKK